LPPEVQKAPVTYTFETHAGQVRKFSTTLFELKVKDACKPCNDLDEPLQGERTGLDHRHVAGQGA
jgi:hypothetical protein